MIFNFIISAVVGFGCIGLGISNRRGNISSLHSYHRNRVSEQDRVPYGKAVGLGMIIVGITLVTDAVLSLVAHFSGNEIFTLIGKAVMIVGLLIGIIVLFRAMRKYNKGIF